MRMTFFMSGNIFDEVEQKRGTVARPRFLSKGICIGSQMRPMSGASISTPRRTTQGGM